ncbi:MAG: nucleotide sugar dehydrogenase [Candidatus Eremiobacteraeota bacterium]|nr:nucleotide sugar dehydrogenase [Candidatus Eremiobacteraeota bacterium]
MHVRIVGLGPIGTRFAVESLERGHRVTAIDIDQSRLARVAADRNDPLNRYREANAPLELATQPSPGAGCDVTRICVGTTGADGDFDGSSVDFALGALEPMLAKGELVAIESTVPPFSTQTRFRAILESGGRIVGEDVFLVAAPERTDVARSRDESIPKVVGGVTPACTRRGVEIFERLVDTVVPVRSAAVAEAAKMLENAFRFVNVAFANEFAEALAAAGLEPRDVVAAAATKPFGFMAFWPGTGIGGDCVPLAARLYCDFAVTTQTEAAIAGAALRSDALAPQRILRRIERAAGGQAKRVLLLGLSYKSFARSTAWSPGARLARFLVERGLQVDIIEPALTRLDDGSLGTLVTAETLRQPYDVAIVAAWNEEVGAILERKPATVVLDLSGSPHV